MKGFEPLDRGMMFSEFPPEPLKRFVVGDDTATADELVRIGDYLLLERAGEEVPLGEPQLTGLLGWDSGSQVIFGEPGEPSQALRAQDLSTDDSMGDTMGPRSADVVQEGAYPHELQVHRMTIISDLSSNFEGLAFDRETVVDHLGGTAHLAQNLKCPLTG